MIGELLAQKADLAVADLTITYEREQVSFLLGPTLRLLY
jgi:hypothetical protein